MTVGIALCIILTLALLLASARLGIAIRPEAEVRALPSGSDLDYGRGPLGGFSALRAGFIRGVLGDVISVAEARSADVTARRGMAKDRRRIVEVHELTNDDLSAARAIPAVPFTAKTRTTNATREATEPAGCSNTGTTVWYRFVPDEDIALVAHTFGSNYAISLGVFTGGPDQLRLVSCDTDAGGNALAALIAKAGESIFIQVTARVAGGELVFSLDPQGTTELISRSSGGDPANGAASDSVALSGDGRFVAFLSTATNLAPGIPDCRTRSPEAVVLPGPCQQAYVHDRSTGTTELVSKGPSGRPANSHVSNVFISRSGRFVTFESPASNLVDGDTNDLWDLFVHDRVLDSTERLPISAQNAIDGSRETVNNYFWATISDDGRYVAFNTPGTGLVPDDTNGDTDVFVYDRHARTIERISQSSSGRQMEGRTRPGVLYPSMSPDGRYVSFISDSPTLVEGDTNGFEDVFVHDRLTRTTERVSVSSSGRQTNNQTWVPGPPRSVMSDDGRYVVFCSNASNLTPDDTNNGPDVFVRDRVAGTTTRIRGVKASIDRSAVSYTFPPWSPSMYSISGDGRYVAFDTTAPDLAPGDDGDDWDVVLHDLHTGSSVLVTVSSSGGDLSGQAPVVSADGRVVVYVAGVRFDRETDASDRTHVFAYEVARAR